MNEKTQRKLEYIKAWIDWYIENDGEELGRHSLIPKSSFVVIGHEIFDRPNIKDLCKTLKRTV